MTHLKVVAYKNLPSRPPFLQGILFWLLLDRLKPPGWVWGAVGCLYGIWVVITFVAMFGIEDTTDIFEKRVA